MRVFANTVSPKVPSPSTRTPPHRIWRFIGESQLRWWFQGQNKEYGQWIRTELTSLGPAFVKLGQFLSTRADVFGPEVGAELVKLQDNLTPIPYEEVENVLTTSLGHAWQDVFVHIDPVPLASASIGQVHRARLKQNQKEVVIKLQKPGIATQIRNDISTLQSMNELFSKTGSPRAQEIDRILQQYTGFLAAELDFRREIEHMVEFRRHQDTGGPMKIPKVYTEYSGAHVIVMEYVPSVKITDVDEMVRRDWDRARIADHLVQCFLYQIIYMGIVHCDPHPGNIGVHEDGETIVLYDFGNVVRLSPDFREQLNTLVFSVFQKDVDDFLGILMSLGVIEVTSEEDLLELKEFFRYFFAYLETLDFASLKSSVLQQEMRQTSQLKLKINPDFLSLFRVFSMLDGTCAKLNPSFNYIEALRPFADDILRDVRFLDARVRKDIDKMLHTTRSLRDLDQNMVRMQRRIRTMQNTQQEWLLLLAAWISAVTIFDVHGSYAAIILFLGIWWTMRQSR